MGSQTYNAGARALHWAIALLILAALTTGLLHEPLEKVVTLIPLHKSMGLTILALSLVRLGWRLTWRAPAYPATVSAGERQLAKAVHVLLYALMIAMPLTGWIIASAGKYPLTWFGLFDWPKLAVLRQMPIYGFGHEFHEIGGWVLLALALGHAGAALRHHFVLRDGVMRRML